MRACECIICDNRPLSLCHEPPNDPFEKAQTQVYADVVMETKVEAISRISNYFLTCKIQGCAVNLNYDTAPIFSSLLYFICSFTWIIFPITTFWAYSIRIEGDTAKRTAVDVILCGKLGRRGIHTACESDFAMFSLSFNKSYTILIIPSTVMVSLVTTRRASG